MAKQNRGKSLAKLESRGRGTCTICYTTRTKLLYKRKKADGTSLSVCKRCVNVSEQKLNETIVTSMPLAFRRKHRKQFYAQV